MPPEHDEREADEEEENEDERDEKEEVRSRRGFGRGLIRLLAYSCILKENGDKKAKPKKSIRKK